MVSQITSLCTILLIVVNGATYHVGQSPKEVYIIYGTTYHVGRSPKEVYIIFKKVVSNYIWLTKENHATWAKVVWHVLTSPKLRGGMCLIDPQSQTKELLAKFVVRGIQPKDNGCEVLLRLRFTFFKPQTGAWALRWEGF